MPLPLYQDVDPTRAPPLSEGPELHEATLEVLLRQENRRQYALADDFDDVSGWVGTIDSSVSLGTAADDPFEGDSCLKSTTTTPFQFSSVGPVPAVKVPVEPGAKYAGEFRARRVNAYSVPIVAFSVIYQYTSTGVLIPNSNLQSAGRTLELEDQWYRIPFWFEAHSLAAYWGPEMWVFLSTGNIPSGDVFLFDKFRLWKGSIFDYERIAMVSDLVSGVQEKQSLISADELTFTVPFDRFVPSQAKVSYAERIKSLSPAIYWRLGEDGLVDQSGNNQAEGTTSGGVTVGGAAGALKGDTDAATDFDGTDDKVLSTYDPSVVDSIRTYEGWGFRDSTGTTDTLFGGNTAGGNTPVYRLIVTSTAQVVWVPNGAHTLTWAANTWPVGWVHWVLVYDDATETATLYINGVAQPAPTPAGSGGYSGTGGPIQWGVRNGILNSDPWDGKQDEVAVYERALTAAEIQANYLLGSQGRQPGTLRSLQGEWDAEANAPYDKQSSVRDDVYIGYTNRRGRHRMFRVSTLDSENLQALSGMAVESPIELTDFLTQYRPGLSSFSGRVPSKIANRILQGHQSLRVPNRKFSRDSPVRMTLANDIPDMTPQRTPEGRWFKPSPYATELFSINPDEIALFSGIPGETVDPNGYAGTLPTGSVRREVFNNYPEIVGTYVSEGAFVILVEESDWDPGTVFDSASEAPVYPIKPALSSTIYSGSIKPDQTGVYTFTFTSVHQSRAFFRGAEVGYDPDNFADLTWSSELTAGQWYPFFIYALNDDSTTFLDRELTWDPPSGGVVTVPLTNLSPVWHGGLGLCRFMDVAGVIRFMTFYKSYTGKSIFLGYPIHAEWSPLVTKGSLWPRGAPAGTVIEEVRFPSSANAARVIDWGTGWTRRPGARSLLLPPAESVRFQSEASEY